MKFVVLLTSFLLCGHTLANAATSTADNPFGTTANATTTQATADSDQHWEARKRRSSSRSSSKSSSGSSSGSCGNLPRTCGQMTSCAQAQKALQCGNTRLDRDKDGVPCESICG